MRCGEVAAMPRAFGLDGRMEELRREMEDEETTARAPRPTDITIFHQCPSPQL